MNEMSASIATGGTGSRRYAEDVLREPLRYLAGCCSDAGARGRNEDWCHAEPGLLCVCDGIGGAPYGDIMARLCCRAFCEQVVLSVGAGGARAADALEDIVADALAKTDVFASRVARYLGGGPGSTLVAAVASGDNAVFASVGDSAAFMLQGRELVRVFADDGRDASAREGTLSAALGYGMLARSDVHNHVARRRMRPGCAAILCTDGVWSQLPSRLMNGMALMEPDPGTLADEIVRRAVETAPTTSDNATAAVMYAVPATRWRDGDAAPESGGSS